jgi:hypothetical protein
MPPHLSLVRPTVEQLARLPRPETNLSRENLDEVAALALALMQHDLSVSEQIGADLRTYTERSEEERARMRRGAHRVLQALVLLGWIDTPE